MRVEDWFYRLTRRVLPFLVLAVVALSLIAFFALLPQSWTWVPKLVRSAGPACSAVVPLLTALIFWLGFHERRRAERQLKRADEESKLVDLVLAALEDRALTLGKPFSYYRTGVAVWAIGDAPRRDRKAPQQLILAFRQRPHHRHGHTGVEWTVEKGVIGRAIRKNTPELVNLEEVWGPLRTVSRTVWDEQDAEVRMGLSYEEFKRSCPSGTGIDVLYSILAVPIFLEERLVGCAALDIPCGLGEASLGSGVQSSLSVLGETVIAGRPRRVAYEPR